MSSKNQYQVWSDEMDVLYEWVRLNWEKTGRTNKAAGVTGSIHLGQGPQSCAKPAPKRKKHLTYFC